MSTTADAPVDITDPATFAQGIPHAVFAEMRRTEPIAERMYEGRPFWAVTRYRDLVTVTRDPQTYSNARGMTNLPDLTEEQMNARRSIIDTDAPDHIRLRKLGIPAFTSHKVKSYEEVTREIAAQLLAEAVDRGSVDVVQAISAPLPIRVIINILGVPEEDAAMLVQWSDELIDSTGVPADAYGNTTPLELLPFSAPASHALFEYGRKMREERTRNPQDDLTTALVEARYEGEALSDYDFKNMFHVLVFAGNETRARRSATGSRPSRRTPTSSSCSTSARSWWRTPSRRSSGGPRPSSTCVAPPRVTPSWPGCRSRRTTRSSSGTRRPTSTRRSSSIRCASTSRGR